MASKWVDERDLRFILHEVFNISDDILGKAPIEDHDTDMVNMVIDAAVNFAENEDVVAVGKKNGELVYLTQGLSEKM
jgi:hypothetical protein